MKLHSEENKTIHFIFLTIEIWFLPKHFIWLTFLPFAYNFRWQLFKKKRERMGLAMFWILSFIFVCLTQKWYEIHSNRSINVDSVREFQQHPSIFVCWLPCTRSDIAVYHYLFLSHRLLSFDLLPSLHQMSSSMDFWSPILNKLTKYNAIHFASQLNRYKNREW